MTRMRSNTGAMLRLRSVFKTLSAFGGRTMGLGLPKDYRELLELLNEKGVRYLVVGGYAVGHYGHSRSTNDIDFFISGDESNARKMVLALEEFGFGVGELTSDLFTKKDSLVVMGVEPMAIDILNYCKGIEFEEAYSRRVLVDDEGLVVNLIAYDDLMTNKRAVGRLKDQADVEYLERIRKT
ncbi:MAG: nucleotidyltransferase [Pyrinomonadaceae bacterium]